MQAPELNLNPLSSSLERSKPAINLLYILRFRVRELMKMTMTPHSGSAKLCANTNCRTPVQATNLSWNCPNGCFSLLCLGCSCCDSCEKGTRSILPLNPVRPAAPFRMRNLEGTSSITVVGAATGGTPCLLNSSNTEPSRLGDERKNSIAKWSSQIRASQMVKQKTALGMEHSRWRNLFGKVPHLPPFSSDRHSNPLSRVPLAKNQITNGRFIHNPLSRAPPATPVAKNRIANQERVSKMRSTPPASSLKSKNGRKSFTAAKPQSQILPRYMPKMTDQELKQIARGSNAKVTPLFEKELTKSDTGRIGRLVLPKKCAETYFPEPVEPFGEMLTIQDAKGKDWKLNFRCWPNNNSRMYVLEGFNSFVKSMDLKEGDTVTFSRLEPEGKLVMGYRKAKTASSSNQAMLTVIPHIDVSKGNTDSPTSIQSEVVRPKRKSSKMGSAIEPEKDMIALDLTSKEAQELVWPHPGSPVPNPEVIDGVEITSYKDHPDIGRPTIIDNRDGIMIQWAECEGCYKWRKVPIDVVIPAGWTCSHNQWDPQRSRCSATEQVMSNAKVKECLTRTSEGSSKKMKIGNQQPEQPETVVGRDALAVIPNEENVPPALQSPAKATTKHPRHRPGCSCVVCSQAPSGTKHSSTCTCGGCMTVRRRHQTRRGKKPAGTIRRKRTRRSENTRSSAVAAVSKINKKKPCPQPDSIMKQAELGGSSSSQLILKPAQHPASILKSPVLGNSIIPILQMNKPTENHQTSKSAPDKTEPRLFDLNLLPEPDDDEDSMQ